MNKAGLLILVAAGVATSLLSYQYRGHLVGLLPGQVIASDAPLPGLTGTARPIETGPEVPLSLHIRVDQFGYRPIDRKVAVLRDPQKGFDAQLSFSPGEQYQVRQVASGQVVHEGRPKAWNGGKVQSSSGDRGWWYDFSELQSPGHYYVMDVSNGVRSPTFRIGEDVYREVLKAAVKTFYYQRSGFEKKAPHADACWTDEAAFLGKNQDQAARHFFDRESDDRVRDLRGGWYDAGDTNKYVTFASRPIHLLFSAYRHHPEVFTDDFGIPESGNGIPDLIDELKWQTDWLIRMQEPDGRVLVKVGSESHDSKSPPSDNRRQSFYVGPCTSATITASAMYAHAALVLREFPRFEAYAANLEQRAVAAFDAYRKADQLQTQCDQGEVKAGDADQDVATQAEMAVASAAYLYALTGKARFLEDFSSHYLDTAPMKGIEWSRYKPELSEALLYFSSLDSVPSKIRKKIRQAKQRASGNRDIYGMDERDLYRNYMPDDQYHWGSNAARANAGIDNLGMVQHGLADSLDSAFGARAMENLHYLHGVNPLGIAYLSNMYGLGATYSVNEIYHEWYRRGTPWANARRSKCGPPPGFLVGGPNKNAANDGVPGELVPPVGQPPQKSYRDWNAGWPEASWAVTENSNTYQASYIALLAPFAGP